MYEKSIRYDRSTRDYAMYLDGELVGFARTHHEAEVTLDQLVFELMNAAPAEATSAEPPTTCVFCHKPHHPQKCPEMRTLLFAPDAPNCSCGCENDPDTHYGNLELAEAQRLDERDDNRDARCPDCGEVYCECDEDWATPLDLDFAPLGPEV